VCERPPEGADGRCPAALKRLDSGQDEEAQGAIAHIGPHVPSLYAAPPLSYKARMTLPAAHALRITGPAL